MSAGDGACVVSRASARISVNAYNTRCSNAKLTPHNGPFCALGLIEEIDEKLDSLRFYRLGSNWRSRVEHVGSKPSYDPDGPLVF